MNVQYIDHMGSDASIVKAARVSFAADDEIRSIEKDTGLINYLAKHKHWTPFSHTALTVRMKAPVPIRTQCFKHKVGFTENEESRRYIDNRPEYFMPTFRKTTENKKQGSGKEFGLHANMAEQAMYKAHCDSAIVAYEAALARGVCEEQARFYLPQGCIVNWYWTGNLMSFARFFAQRTDSHAQKEIQELAHEVGAIIAPLFPLGWVALTK
jgi:thymidylate synthase (FAD)